MTRQELEVDLFILATIGKCHGAEENEYEELVHEVRLMMDEWKRQLIHEWAGKVRAMDIEGYPITPSEVADQLEKLSTRVRIG